MLVPWLGTEYTIRGKVVASPKSRLWWVLWVRIYSWLVLAPKMFKLCINQLVVWFVQVCASDWLLVILPSLVPELQHAPLPPQSVASQGAYPNSLFFCYFHFRFTSESIKELGSVSKGFTTKDFQMKHIWFPMTPCFLKGLGIESLGWTLIFDVHCHVHCFNPKLKFQPLCKNHASHTFHDSFIDTFHNNILLWGIKRIYLSLNSKFYKKCVKLFGHEFLGCQIVTFWFCEPFCSPPLPCIVWIFQTLFL